MSEEIRTRFKEICPSKLMENVDVIEAESDCKTAFKIIGKIPENFDSAFSKTWITSKAEMLSDFIYDVWRCANE